MGAGRVAVSSLAVIPGRLPAIPRCCSTRPSAPSALDSPRVRRCGRHRPRARPLSQAVPIRRACHSYAGGPSAEVRLGCHLSPTTPPIWGGHVNTPQREATVTPSPGAIGHYVDRVSTVDERRRDEVLLIDGGDLACGELLMLVYRQIRPEPAGSVVGITTTDPAAPIDIPAWCHLTGHHYRGLSREHPNGTYLVELATCARPVDPQRPWHPQPSTEVLP